MRNLGLAVALAAFISIGVEAQQPAPSSAPVQSNPPTLGKVKLYNTEQGLTAPALLPLQIHDPIESECKGEKESGVVGFSFIVDEAGRARNIVFDRVLGNAMDYLAVRIMELDRFQPATLNGAPVAAEGALKMRLEFCVTAVKGQDGAQAHSFHLRSFPEQRLETPARTQNAAVLAPIPDPQATPGPPEKVGNGVTPPHALNSPQAQFSDYAQRDNIQGGCEFIMVVDEHGLPHDIQVVTPIEPSLLESAYEAIRQYRFKPGTKNGAPVQVQIKVRVNFQTEVAR